MTNDVDTPAAVRRLDTPDALALADLAAIFEDLQTVLRACERLMVELGSGSPDDLALEAFWTTAVLSYTRCFSTRESGTGLTPEDVTATGIQGDVLGWHDVLLQLRDHYTDPRVNPREAFSVGVSQDAEGRANGVAVTSASPARVDDVTVRQTGAISYALSVTIDQRIAAHQEGLFATLGPMSKAELDQLPLVEVAPET
jgi:hypothetical protein